jgi:hypothetical protein
MGTQYKLFFLKNYERDFDVIQSKKRKFLMYESKFKNVSITRDRMGTQFKFLLFLKNYIRDLDFFINKKSIFSKYKSKFTNNFSFSH